MTSSSPAAASYLFQPCRGLLEQLDGAGEDEVVFQWDGQCGRVEGAPVRQVPVHLIETMSTRWLLPVGCFDLFRRPICTY